MRRGITFTSAAAVVLTSSMVSADLRPHVLVNHIASDTRSSKSVIVQSATDRTS